MEHLSGIIIYRIQILYSSKFSWHNIFVIFVINPSFTNFLFTNIIRYIVISKLIGVAFSTCFLVCHSYIPNSTCTKVDKEHRLGTGKAVYMWVSYLYPIDYYSWQVLHKGSAWNDFSRPLGWYFLCLPYTVCLLWYYIRQTAYPMQFVFYYNNSTQACCCLGNWH